VLVYAHKQHRYEDVASGTVYQFQVGIVLDVNEEVGRVVVEGHPGKLCDVSSELKPGEHSCELSAQQTYENTALAEPPSNRVMQTSAHVSRGHQPKIKNRSAYRSSARRERLLNG